MGVPHPYLGWVSSFFSSFVVTLALLFALKGVGDRAFYRYGMPSTSIQLANEGRESSERSLAPLPRILLGPTRARGARGIRATNLETAATIEVEGRGPGARCPDVDRHQDVGPRAIG